MEDKPQEAIEDPRESLRPTGGRDELNLAEFPITLLSDRVPKGCKTLVFEIEPRDRRTGQVTTRKVEITGSDAYGLPTALDDEILVALIQLTKLKNDFTVPTVSFSRYEILRLLDWPDDGRSYRRVQESIKRWTGVTLYYDNAWRNNETGTWMTENFHIIERSSLMNLETKRVHRARGQDQLAFSSFTWSEFIFRSFQSGSLKRLDIDAYFSYKTSIAKRMYRFLDKKFWVKDRWEFDLKEFAFHHIGLSSNYNVAQIKNKLEPALEELSQSTKERAAFLEAMDPDDRYKKLGKGRWLINLSRKMLSAIVLDVAKPEPSGLVLELVNRGVTPQVAAELVNASPPELIAERLEVYDWLIEKKNQKVIKESPTGYLISSIRDRYLTKPKGFETKADRVKREDVEKERLRQEAEAARRRQAERDREKADDAQVRHYWSGLNLDGQKQLEAQALNEASPEMRQNYETAKDQIFRDMNLRAIRDKHIRRILGIEPASPTVQ